MAESKNQKDKRENEDIKFNREELLSDDPEVRNLALEKRNKAMPESMRDNPEQIFGWPPTEDKLPAAMPADKESDHDYQLETYEKVPEEAREAEVRGQPGDVARAEVNKVIAKTIEEGGDLNDVQAPPSANAELAAKGEGAQSAKLPTGGVPANRLPAAKSTAKADNK